MKIRRSETLLKTLLRREVLFAGVAGLTAIMAILAMPQLVATPKLLFGRSLSAIAPSLFPYITLTLILLLSATLIFLSLLNFRRPTAAITQNENGALADTTTDTDKNGLLKTSLFFILLTGYGLLLKPAGFLISSFLAISAISLMLGNRNWLQILLLAILAPVCLYLVATRAMLVSLPELNQIELWYATAINWAMSHITR